MANPTYWIVGGSTADKGREQLYSVLKSRISKQRLVENAFMFDIPTNIKYGSFDDLIRLVDELAKHDSYCESALRRMERQTLEVDPGAVLKVTWGRRNAMTVDDYLSRFVWDDAKFPRSRHLRDNVEIIVSSVQKLDEEMRVRMQVLHEVKQNHMGKAKKDNVPLAQSDLSDLLSPDVVKSSDFIETENLVTPVVIVPRGAEKHWIESYENLAENVVPRSTKKFNFVDKEGNTLWRVVVFKRNLEQLKVACKSKRFTLREFSYSEDSYKKKMEERTSLEAEKMRQEQFINRICTAAFSEAFIALTHLKAIRVFVEAVLRYGVPPKFAAFILKPAHTKETKLRKELNEVFTGDGIWGKSYAESSEDIAQLTGEADEQFYSYVSLTLIPFAGGK